jgi:hypothetical protein
VANNHHRAETINVHPATNNDLRGAKGPILQRGETSRRKTRVETAIAGRKAHARADHSNLVDLVLRNSLEVIPRQRINPKRRANGSAL